MVSFSLHELDGGGGDLTGGGHDEQKDAVQRGLHRLRVQVLPWDLQLQPTFYSTRDTLSETIFTSDLYGGGWEEVGRGSHLCGPPSL